MKTILLTRGKVTIVDDEDYARLSDYTWYCDSTNGDARRTVPKSGNKKVLLHREIMACPQDLVVDHINRDRLDNRKSNLRICTQSENTFNHSRPPGISGYTGVRYHKNLKKSPYSAWYQVNKRTVNIGRFDTPEEAAYARDYCIATEYGNFGILNFPQLFKVKQDEN